MSPRPDYAGPPDERGRLAHGVYSPATLKLLDAVQREQRKLDRLESKIADQREVRDEAIRQAAAGGATLSDAGRAASGMRHSYVQKIVGKGPS